MPSTFSSRAMAGNCLFVLLYRMTEVREIAPVQPTREIQAGHVDGAGAVPARDGRVEHERTSDRSSRRLERDTTE